MKPRESSYCKRGAAKIRNSIQNKGRARNTYNLSSGRGNRYAKSDD